jgi:rhamnopyranosyl-N-acetylglucosaminyl-diphospho-decaprenol beta-1,3/1,4-galactofuranosyltransferase
MRIAAVVVTSGRPRELQTLLQALALQNRHPDCILVVENIPTPETAKALALHPDVRHIVSHRNLGGAGGFALGILTALADGATHVWLMDDDGLPEQDSCLADLFACAEEFGADVTSPVIVDINDAKRLAFPYFIGRKRLHERAHLEQQTVIRHFAHLFNGALITAATFARYGIPDYRLFLRGDEVDFLQRVLRGGGLVVSLPAIAFRHPSGASETFPIIGGRLNAVVPTGHFKQYHFFRNRGYLLRRHKSVLQALSDLIRYPWYYIVSQGGDWRGLGWCFHLMAQGWREDFKPYSNPPADVGNARTSAPPTRTVADRGMAAFDQGHAPASEADPYRPSA